MKNLALGLAACVVVATAVAFSRHAGPPGLRLDAQKRNPWTHARPNDEPGSFQFAIVSDRTGGHRAKVFSQAVDRLNLMQPEFVVSVGDLIEGGKKKPDALDKEWREFDGYVKQLQMPFFYVPGNHDVGNEGTRKLWTERYGRRYYHFVYRGVLFLCLDTDDPTNATGVPSLGKEQLAYAKKALADNKNARWTIVLLHKPIWTSNKLKERGWRDVERALDGRPYTVFCGHVHRYRKFVRQGRDYYQLATTGGGSKMRGLPYGEFDQIVWVTMKKDGPVLANVLLDSILDDDLRVPESSEEGVKYDARPIYPVRGVVHLDGSPVAGAFVTFTRTEAKTKRVVRADALTESDGSFQLSTRRANDGAPAGTYQVTVVQRRPQWAPEGRPGPNLLPGRYAEAKTSGLTAEVKEGMGEVRLELTR
jgi:hypothetical protein